MYFLKLSKNEERNNYPSIDIYDEDLTASYVINYNSTLLDILSYKLFYKYL